MALTVAAAVILTRMYQTTAEGDTIKVTSLGMILGGAIGNLIDRIRSGQGVVDFIDVGIGDMRWPTFNVADIGVSCGALLLAWVLWREDRAAAATTEQSSAR
jgi:signal peptidase II